MQSMIRNNEDQLTKEITLEDFACHLILSFSFFRVFCGLRKSGILTRQPGGL
jgi:hypothetical protein